MIREPFRTQYQTYLQKHFPDYTIIPANTEVFCEYRLKNDNLISDRLKIDNLKINQLITDQPTTDHLTTDHLTTGQLTKPFLILCDSDLDLRDASGTGFPRIAVSHQDNTGESLMNAPWLIQSPSALTEDFLKEIYCRHYGLPLVILSTDHFRLRELSSDDLAGLMKLQSENRENPAACFFPKRIFAGRNSDSVDKKARDKKETIISLNSLGPAEVYLKDYISHQYPFYGYGIYAIETISDQEEAIDQSAFRPMEKRKEELIGIAGFHERQDRMEVGYALFKKYQGRGIMSEILPALINYGIEKYEFEDLQASISTTNESSIKLAEKCGLKIHKL